MSSSSQRDDFGFEGEMMPGLGLLVRICLDEALCSCVDSSKIMLTRLVYQAQECIRDDMRFYRASSLCCNVRAWRGSVISVDHVCVRINPILPHEVSRYVAVPMVLPHCEPTEGPNAPVNTHTLSPRWRGARASAETFCRGQCMGQGLPIFQPFSLDCIEASDNSSEATRHGRTVACRRSR